MAADGAQARKNKHMKERINPLLEMLMVDCLRKMPDDPLPLMLQILESDRQPGSSAPSGAAPARAASESARVFTAILQSKEEVPITIKHRDAYVAELVMLLDKAKPLPRDQEWKVFDGPPPDGKKLGDCDLLPSSRRVCAVPAPLEKRKGPPPLIGNGRFLLDKKIGQGCFGGIHRGRDLETRGDVAAKVEEARSSAPQLEHEMRILQLLAKPARPQGISKIYQYGTAGEYNFLVMELLGKSLEDRVQMMRGKLDIKTSTLLGQQIMRPIEYFHSKGLMHRDIKPENFMFGNDAKILHLYIIDFGLSKKYWDKGHIPAKTGRSFTGTARYASINCHAGHEQSRRDDLEAIGHMLLYFLRGHMPWSGLDAPTRDAKTKLIMETKRKIPLPELCKGFPPAFENYLRYCRGMEFKQRPDYAMLRRGFREAREAYEAEHGRVPDGEYQWYVGRKLPDNVIPSDQFAEEPLRQPDD